MAFLSLANEITIQIIECLDNQRDINSVCRINRRFHDLWNEYLFRFNIQFRESSALLWFAKHGREPIARKLLHLGADVDIKLQIYPACSRTFRTSSVDYTKAQLGLTPLRMAAWKGHLAIVKLLLEMGANPETRTSRSWTPLYAALASGHEKIGRTIFRHISNPYLCLVDSAEMLTPLHVASRFGLSNSARHFLEKGADINATDKSGRTPLRHALESDPCVSRLDNDFAVYSVADNLAVPNSDQILETVIVLLEFGANPDLETTEEFILRPKIRTRELGACYRDKRVRAVFHSGAEVSSLKSSKPDRLQIGRTWISPSSSDFSRRRSDGLVLGIQINDEHSSRTQSSFEFPRLSYLSVRRPDNWRLGALDTGSFPVLDNARTSSFPNLQMPPPASPWSPSNVGCLVAGFSATVEPETPPTSKQPTQVDPFPQHSSHNSKNLLGRTTSQLWTNFSKRRDHLVVEDLFIDCASAASGGKNPVPGSKRANGRGKDDGNR